MVQGLLDAVGPEMAAKLGRPVYSNTVVAEVSEYMQERSGRTRTSNFVKIDVSITHFDYQVRVQGGHQGGGLHRGQPQQPRRPSHETWGYR